MLSHLGVLFMHLLARLPLAWIRALGWVFGHLLYPLVIRRRRVVHVNLALCFPDWSAAKRRAVAIAVFVRFTQAWLDRSWLWHGSQAVVRRRLRLCASVESLSGNNAPCVIFAPHFFGLDAGWTALTDQIARRFTTIYSNQADPVVDRWILEGRQRFGATRLFGRDDGLRPIVQALRLGEPLYLLPDMNITRQESAFVPFFGVPTATLTSLSRFARMGRARVVPVLTRLTPRGYDVEVLPPWDDFPTDDPVADAATMNRYLEQYVARMPDQYYWVHKRFKARPEGEPPVY